MTDIVELLRFEAQVTEELHPQNSEITVMREAADVIVMLRTELDRANGMLDGAMKLAATERCNAQDARREVAVTAEDVAFWKFQAMWHRAQHVQPKLDIDRADHWKRLDADFDRIRTEENRDRYSPESSREIGS